MTLAWWHFPLIFTTFQDVGRLYQTAELKSSLKFEAQVDSVNLAFDQTAP